MRSSIVVPFIKSWHHLFDGFLPGKNYAITRNTKTGVNICRSLSKFQNIFILVGRCSKDFRQNQNSWDIQNGEPKSSKYAYFLQNLRIFLQNFLNFSDLKTIYIFFISTIVWFWKYIIIVWMSVYSRLKILLPFKTKTSIYLYLINRFQWKYIEKVIRTSSNAFWQKRTSFDTYQSLSKV